MDPLKTSLRCFICLGLGVPRLEDPLRDVGTDLLVCDEFGEEGTRLTTVFTLDPLGVGDSGLELWDCSPLFPPSPLSDEVVEPELTPLEL